MLNHPNITFSPYRKVAGKNLSVLQWMERGCHCYCSYMIIIHQEGEEGASHNLGSLDRGGINQSPQPTTDHGRTHCPVEGKDGVSL